MRRLPDARWQIILHDSSLLRPPLPNHHHIPLPASTAQVVVPPRAANLPVHWQLIPQCLGYKYHGVMHGRPPQPLVRSCRVVIAALQSFRGLPFFRFPHASKWAWWIQSSSGLVLSTCFPHMQT